VSAVKFVAVQFSYVYSDKPMKFPFSVSRHVILKEDIIKRIEEIVETIRTVCFVAGALGMADFSEMHAGNSPSESAMHRSRELFARLQTVVASLAMIVIATSDWLKIWREGRMEACD
jgi:hypothetical protein